MKNKLVTIIVWFYIISIFLITIVAEFFSYAAEEDISLNPNDYARITDVDYKAVVVDEPGSEGKVVITERLTFDVHAASKNNLFWELWRDLPEDTVDGVPVYYQVNSVKQIMPDGNEVPYEESYKLYWDDSDYTSSYYGPGKWYHSDGPYNEDAGRYECVFFYVNGLYREEVVFEIEYEMYNAALLYNDCSDLYLSLYSGDTIKHLKSFDAQILFPDEDMPSPGNYEVYTYGTNANEFPVTESDTLNPGYHTFSFSLDEEDLKFRPYNEYIEFDLVSYGGDKHIFTEYTYYNDYSFDDVLGEIHEEQQDYAQKPAQFKKIKMGIFLVLVAIAIITLIRSLTAGLRMKKKHIFYEPAMEIDYYRDIPSDLDPNFAAALVFCKQKPPKDDSGIYSAILLSLARKGYIELKECAGDDVQITILRNTAPAPFPETVSDTISDAISKTISQPISDTMSDTISGSQQMSLFNTTSDSSLQSSLFDTASDSSLQSSFVGTKSQPEPLTLCEEYYYNLLVRHASGDSILMSIFQRRVAGDYENTDTFAKNIKNSIVNIGIKDGYFQKADYRQPSKKLLSSSKSLMICGVLLITLVNIFSYQTRLDLAFGAYFILGIVCIISSLLLKKQANKYVLLTQFGEDEYEKWRGLYRFLNSDTLIHERTLVELPLWEKYLVYATAFGLSEKVIEAIKLRCPETEDSPVLNNNCYRSRNFRHSGRSFRSAVHSGSYSARSGGGSFGYGGGGRGGGGGGGGH